MPSSGAAAGSSITTDTRFFDADDPSSPLREVLPRRSDYECTSSHRGDHLISVVRQPDKPNSEVVVSPMSHPSNTKARPAAVALCVYATLPHVGHAAGQQLAGGCAAKGGPGNTKTGLASQTLAFVWQKILPKDCTDLKEAY